jgi:class 3 adenylate cyclase
MARSQAVTILFCDLVASTERRARLGDDTFDEFSGRFFVALRAALERNGGREVSNAGDGMMVVFPESVADAVSCAIEMHKSVAELDVHDPALLRIGISCGEVAQDGDNFSGMPIVEAARLEAAAAPGQTLANGVVRALVGTRRALRFRDVGSLTLKGIPEPLATVEVLDEDVVDVQRPVVTPTSEPSSRATRRRWPIVVAVSAGVAVVALVAFVGARGGGSQAHDVAQGLGIHAPIGYSPRYDATECSSTIREAVADAKCGYLVVPQDRSKPSGKQVRLLVSQAPSRNPGSGASSPTIDLCGCNDLASSVARDHGTLIQIGGRGFTGSDPVLTCPEMVNVTKAALAQPSDDPTVLADENAALSTCYARLKSNGIDPAQYNFKTSAIDVTDLMVALKIQRANFTASELTSAVVFEVLRHAPGAVRSLTLDNPAPPGATQLTNPVGNLATAFGHYADLCQANPECAHAYPDLRGSYRSTYEALQAHPQLVSTPDPDDTSQPAVPVLMDGPRVADALASALGNPGTYGLIPAAITAPSATPVVAAQVLSGDYYLWHRDAPWGALASYLCAYDIHTADPGGIALAARTLPQFRTGHDAHWVDWCGAWKVPDVSDALSSDVAGSEPAFLFRGNLSPSGDASWIANVERGLSQAQTAVFPTLGDGLTSGGPPCLADLQRAFLANPTAKLATSACVRQSPPISFVTASS